MKVSIIYVSQTGNTEVAAESIQDGILKKYPFIQVKLTNIREEDTDVKFLAESDVVIFGSPVYFTSLSWELKKWFDNSFRINLQGKLGTAFVTAQSPAGGTDTALMEIMRYMLLKGMFVNSGIDRHSDRGFQIGMIGLAQDKQLEEKFETMGEYIAQAAVELFGR